jgi:hypothetical protein
MEGFAIQTSHFSQNMAAKRCHQIFHGETDQLPKKKPLTGEAMKGLVITVYPSI